MTTSDLRPNKLRRPELETSTVQTVVEHPGAGDTDKVCLLVLGMHRSGTSALTRVMNLLGYALPNNLVGAIEGNEAGHWEPENVVLYNDQLLADMKSSWHDFRALPTTRLGPAEIHKAETQIAELLDREYGSRERIILKDPRLCRFASIYMQALDGMGYRIAPIVIFRNPAEVIRSLQNRRSNWPEGYSASQAALMWLRHVLDAEFTSRGIKRSFMEYSAFLKNWQAEILRASQQGSFEFSESLNDIAPLIEEFLRPDLRHEQESMTEFSGQPALQGWCHKAYDALRRLVVMPDSVSAMETLNEIRAEFDAAELPLSALSENSVATIRNVSHELGQIIEGQDRQIAELETKNRTLFETRAEELKAALQRIEGQDRQIAELNSLFHDRNLQIEQLLSSRSWRITAPLRTCSQMFRSMRDTGRTFRSASAAKGGLIAGTGSALHILVKEGPKGLRMRLANAKGAQQTVVSLPPSTANIVPFTCFIATTKHVESLAQMMARVLRVEGYTVTVRTDLVGAKHTEHVFVICPQMFENLPEHYIAVQMEQSVSSRWFTPDYFDKLNQARAIIDYSIVNLSFLREHDLPLDKLHYVPIDSDRELLPTVETSRSGILFYGDDKCPRRAHILNVIAKAYPELRVINNLFGKDLEDELRRAAVVLNVHYYENALLETARVYQALSYGTPVVSEESSDQSEHQMLNGIVDFAPIGDVERIIELLRPHVEGSTGTIKKRAAVAAFATRAENRFEMFFRRFLLSQKMIDYNAFSLRAPQYPIELKEPVKLCLSLPETPRRRTQFVNQEQKGFVVWDGLKATPGWVGAAMSYRHIFERISATGADRAIICEDDVLFPSNFSERLEIVERYLKSHSWDVFSGFIADAHADLKIEHVEEFEGQTFVHIDRTVSMVFNIYNRDIMKFMTKWEPSNQNVHTNTIDRYLENHGDMRVVLTLPFLVDHRPDTTSTIWGFQNTQYNETVKKSEQRLTKKVNHFLKSRSNQ